MMTTQEFLNLIVYGPALVGSDSRILAVVHGMERALPGLRLEWRVSKEGHPVPLPQRDAWLMEARPDGGFPLVCNGDESHPITLFGLENPAGLSAGGRPLFDVHAELPLDTSVISVAEHLLENVAEGAQAMWGQATPFTARVEIARQTRHSLDEPYHHPRGLPPLKLSKELRSSEIPRELGWLNYWSAAAAYTIGFPDPARDADLLSRSRRTASGGWIVRLTEAPLDLDIPEHLDALLRAYERFPVIGGRDT